MGHADGIERNKGRGVRQPPRGGLDESKQDMADSHGERFQGERFEMFAREQCSPWGESDRCCVPVWPPGPADLERWSTIPVELWPSVKSSIRRVAYGLPEGLGFRRNQLHALGNSVVPLQAAYAFVALAQVFAI